MFEIGDKVRIKKEPFFYTNHNNGIWKMHPDERKGKPCDPKSMDFINCNEDGIYEPFFGAADMTHLIGCECEIFDKYTLPIGKGITYYCLKIPLDHPRGLSDFTEEDLELVK